jgi:hypothetical protein
MRAIERRAYRPGPGAIRAKVREGRSLDCDYGLLL